MIGVCIDSTIAVRKKGINFKMATIPEKMPDIIDVPTEFSPTRMTKLFNVGYKIGYEGVDWKKSIAFEEYDNHK